MAIKIQGTTVVTNERAVENVNTVYQSSANNSLFWGNAKVISANTTLANTHNHMSIGPVDIANGVVVTVSPGASWAIV